MFKKSPSKGPVPGSSKSKKSSQKDKERKKTTQHNQTETTNHEKCPNLEVGESYAGFGPDTVSVIAEQFLNVDDLPGSVCDALAEDMSYRIRELLTAASVTMRLSKRSYLKCDDIDSAFHRLNLEPVYGAGMPNWITFGDPNNYTCILTKPVDLVSISQSDMTVLEPGDMGLEYRWLKDTSTLSNLTCVDETLKRYCDTVMKYSISKKEALRKAVLKDVTRNLKIGPIVPALCNFCFLILQKNITYSYLAMPVLQLLEAVMFNPSTSFSAEEKQVTLLIYLLLESIMNASNTMTNEVYTTCRTLGRMCACWTIGSKIVIDKIGKHLPPEPYKRLTSPVISALTFIGSDALNIVFWPHVSEFFGRLHELEDNEKMDVHTSILNAAILFYKHDNYNRDVHKALFDEYGEMLIPFWDHQDRRTAEKTTVQTESNWFQLKKYMMKTLKIQSKQDTINRQSRHGLAFPEPRIRHDQITIVGFKSLPLRKKRTNSAYYYHQQNKISDSVNIVTGRRTLLTIKRQFLTGSATKTNGLLYTL